MDSNLTTKIFDWTWSKGGVFAILWAIGIYKVISSEDDKLFGLTFNDTEKGLLFVLFSMLCLLLHAGFGAFLSHKKHKDPKSYTKDVFDAVKEVRVILTRIRIPATSLADIKNGIHSIENFIALTPKDNGNRETLLKLRRKLISESADRKTDPNHRDLSITDLLRQFINETEWSLRDKNETNNT